MASRKTQMWIRVVIVTTLMIGSASLSSAQAPQGAGPAGGAAPAQGAGAGGRAGGGRGRGGAAFTPAPGAKDLKSVMFNWGWYTGMLRSDQEYDVLMTLD